MATMLAYESNSMSESETPPTKPSLSGKLKSCLEKNFLHCWRKKSFNKHQEISENPVNKPFRNVLNPKYHTKEYIEQELADLGFGGMGEQMFYILTMAFSSRCLNQYEAKRLGINHVRGMVLYGPPGCGKTVMAQHIWKFIPAKEPLLITNTMVCGFNDGEHMRKARSFLKKAIADEKKYGARSDMYVVIIDCIDYIARRNKTWTPHDDSEELLNELIRLMDGPEALNNIFVIATTNGISLVDQRVLKEGRLSLLFELDYPKEDSRLKMLKVILRNVAADYYLHSDVNIHELALLTDGFSNCAIKMLLTRAHSCALQRNKYTICNLQYKMVDFITAIEQMRRQM